MNENDEDSVKGLLKQAFPPMESDDEPGRDLWPAMLKRLDQESDVSGSTARDQLSWAWFDGALAVSLVGVVVLFPASIPLLLYYL